MDQLHTANKVCGGGCAISFNTVDTESSVSPISGEIKCLTKLNLPPTFINIAKVSKAHIPPAVAIRSHTTLIQKADYRKRYTAIHLMNT